MHLIVVTGPTAVGKTQATLRLAQVFHAPIINADSRQIYAELPIGTAAPTAEEQQQAQHYFVGNHSVTEYYSASIYEQEVLALLRDLQGQHDVAILSGGSMMYIDAVCNGIDDIPTVNDEVRTMMKQRYEAKGLQALVDELKQLDPIHWDMVDKNNPRRVIHALEICLQTGKPYSSFLKRERKERPFSCIKIGLNRDRSVLYDRINQRTIAMVEDGFVDEALKMYPYRHLNALNTVGYKEMFDYLDGLVTLSDTIMKIQSATRRYARKQLTWFKRDPEMRWFDPENVEEILNYIRCKL